MLIQIPGGSAELRTKPTVYGREILQQAGFELMHQLKRVAPQKDVTTFADLKDIPIDEFDGPLLAATHMLQRAAVVALVKSWSLPQPLPTLDNIADMDVDLYDVLAAAVAPGVNAAMSGEAFGADGAADPSSPTAPSPASSDGERGQVDRSTAPMTAPSGSSESFGIAVSSV